MIKGLYSAVTAMLAGVNRQRTLAHDVANLDTPGFKQVLSSMDDFMHTTVFTPESHITGQPTQYVGMMGLVVENAPDTTDYSQGALKYTGNALDLAIEGNGFFQVRTERGERYTRDGRFIRDAQGQMVTVDGFLALDTNGQPITLPEGDVMVQTDGTIQVNGQNVAQLQVAAFLNPLTELTRDGDNLFIAAGAPSGTQGGMVQQNVLEMSNANPTRLMTQLVEVARYYEAAQKMVQNQDELVGKSISTLGRIG